MSSFRTKSLLALTLIIALSLTGCASRTVSQQNQSDTHGLTVMTSFYPMYIMTLNICLNVPDVKVINMTPPQTGCLHDYQLTTTDLKHLEKAQVFVINGAGMESFIEKVINQQPDLKIVNASKGISLLQGAGNIPNPHVWVSPTNAIAQVKNIAAGLAQADPSHADQYRANAAAYIAKIESLRNTMQQELKNVKNRNIVTMHEAFPYFAQEFNLHIAAVVEREPGSEPSAAELARTIEIIKKSGVKVVFAEPQYSTGAIKSIARETGAKVYTLDPAVTGPQNCDAYLTIMRQNLKTLKEALNR